MFPEASSEPRSAPMVPAALASNESASIEGARRHETQNVSANATASLGLERRGNTYEIIAGMTAGLRPAAQLLATIAFGQPVCLPFLPQTKTLSTLSPCALMRTRISTP